ncbi:hypothetical protein [Vibrio gangliei]|uniref:hypothetical protein n=1 Tax=Vibrio gangliei TaxID=2077090 RepID=UPI001FEBDD0A|nr:hypothetical protein [Vibrio gangliei]
MNTMQTKWSTHQTKNATSRKALWIMLVVFALPVIAAKVILSQHWYQSGVTNHGVFIDKPVYYQDLNVINPASHQWQIAYLLPSQCLQLCQQQLHLLKQSHIALGKDQPRVMPVVIVSEPTGQHDLTSIKEMSFVIFQVNDFQSQLQQQGVDVAAQDYVLIDPRGQWVMRFPTVQSSEELPNELKGLLADLRKLLTLSRVG